MSMINIAMLTKRVAPVSECIFLVSSQFASTAVFDIAQTIMPAPALQPSLYCAQFMYSE